MHYKVIWSAVLDNIQTHYAESSHHNQICHNLYLPAESGPVHDYSEQPHWNTIDIRSVSDPELDYSCNLEIAVNILHCEADTAMNRILDHIEHGHDPP